MKSLLLLLLIISSSHNAFAEVGPKRSCPEASAEVPRRMNLQRNLRREGVRLVTQGIEDSHLKQFYNELMKFPRSLRSELVRAGARIHLIQGEGIASDPTWNVTAEDSMIGRPFSEIPGGGGFPWMQVPTRIVVNNLYERGQHGHGSVNLLLHEHAHTLDYIFQDRRLSDSQTWSAALGRTPNLPAFLQMLCTANHCVNHGDEAFAELFAYYHACSETRSHMVQEVPALAEFFRNFRSARRLN